MFILPVVPINCSQEWHCWLSLVSYNCDTLDSKLVDVSYRAVMKLKNLKLDFCQQLSNDAQLSPFRWVLLWSVSGDCHQGGKSRNKVRRSICIRWGQRWHHLLDRQTKWPTAEGDFCFDWFQFFKNRTQAEIILVKIKSDLLLRFLFSQVKQNHL